ncbi:MAG: CotH kinase family protein [Deltaproteobacteria bacterium]|nr:CotH kinase family protein [Deltaproteobacteria bacterium]
MHTITRFSFYSIFIFTLAACDDFPSGATKGCEEATTNDCTAQTDTQTPQSCDPKTETTVVVDNPTPCPTTQLETIAGTVSGLPVGQSVKLTLNDNASATISADGDFSFLSAVATSAIYSIKVTEQPASVYCVVGRGVGAAPAGGVNDIKVTCDDDPATPLFDIDAVHQIRLTITADDWMAFTLTTERSKYTNNAWGDNPDGWNVQHASELYRPATFELLDTNGSVVDKVEKVGFRMRGAYSRVWPVNYQTYGVDITSGIPRRFHYNIKFDETFNEDESIFACVDDQLQPAKVDGWLCYNRIADDVPLFEFDNDGNQISKRKYRGLDSLQLKYNNADQSYIREILSYAILNNRNVLTSRGAFASLQVVITPTANNTELYGRQLPITYEMGVFSMLEPIDKRYLQKRFGENKNGFLFKGSGGDLTNYNSPDRNYSADCVKYDPQISDPSSYTNANFCVIGVERPDPDSREEWVGQANANAGFINSGVNFTNYGYTEVSMFKPYRPHYDLKTKKDSLEDDLQSGEKGARSELTDLIKLIINTSTTLAQLEVVFNVDAFIKQQAVELALGAVDHFVRGANNYYMYQDPDTKVWSMLTYDFDFVFRDTYPENWDNEHPTFNNVVASTIFDNSNSNNTWAENHWPGNKTNLWDIVFSSETNKQKLLAEVGVIRRDWLNWQYRIKPLAEEWLDRIEPYIFVTDVYDPEESLIYIRDAAFGDEIRYMIWVNPTNNRSIDQGGTLVPNYVQPVSSNNTIKNYVIERSKVLAKEAP